MMLRRSESQQQALQQFISQQADVTTTNPTTGQASFFLVLALYPQEGRGLTALASGDAAAWETVSPLIDVLAARKFYLGPGEEARYMKLVLNALVGAMASVLGEALVLGEKGGLSPAQMMEVIGQSAVASPLLEYKREMIARMDFSPAFSVHQMIKDFTLITDAARDKQVPMFVANLILQQYTAASNAGYSEKDFFALFEWMRGEGGLADLA